MRCDPLPACISLFFLREQHPSAPGLNVFAQLRPAVFSHHFAHPQVTIAGIAIPLRFDTHFSFSSHAMDVVRSSRDKLRTLRALAGSGWGCQKETLLRAYKTYVEPIVNYAAAIWVPNVSVSSLSSVSRTAH